MRRFLPLVLLALGGCASAAADRAPAPGPTATTADTAAVLATMRQLFDAMAARDSAALASIVTPAGTFAVVSVEGDSVAVTHASLARFVSNVGRPGPTLQERAWDPLVLLEGPFATVWRATTSTSTASSAIAASTSSRSHAPAADGSSRAAATPCSAMVVHRPRPTRPSGLRDP